MVPALTDDLRALVSPPFHQQLWEEGEGALCNIEIRLDRPTLSAYPERLNRHADTHLGKHEETPAQVLVDKIYTFDTNEEVVLWKLPVPGSWGLSMIIKPQPDSWQEWSEEQIFPESLLHRSIPISQV